jgi:serine/threonine protein kinase
MTSHFDSMDNEADRQIEIFTKALELPLEDRQAYLEQACAGDAELRREVEELIAVNQRSKGFMEDSPWGLETDKARVTQIGEQPGNRIDRYKLLQQIGEGGFGIVFMAEQDQPIKRRVALKIIKPGLDTKNVIARFEAERQALALMDHPNIAKVLDAGATASGRPYFVMELIRGVKITEYCDNNSLSLEERLKLFIQVCNAIQHAHQKGIIHRDIKPSNILVTKTVEGQALPVVIDFGIAKATVNQQLTDKTLFTAFEMLIGTPAYMSPEQAALTNVDADTRSDIYSLGVLLYEISTGSTPFDTQEMLKRGLDEIRRVIREEEPVRPSTRLRRLAINDLTAVSKLRNVEPSKLIREICGDLDLIIIKALEKDRTRRYQTAHALSLDVQRYLADEPVSARPPSALYRFRKLFIRHKLLFLGIGIVALFLIASLITVSAFLAIESQLRHRAETEAAKSDQVTKFLEDMLKGVGPSVALGQDTKMLQGILNQTANRVGTKLTNQPAVQAELSSLVGELDFELGNFTQAKQMDDTALALDLSVYGTNSLQTAEALTDLGLILAREGKLQEAEVPLNEALNISRQLSGETGPNIASLLNYLADVYTQEGRMKEAEAFARQALTIRQQIFASDSLEVAQSIRTLAAVLGNEGHWSEAEVMMRKVLDIRLKNLSADDPLIAGTYNDIAWAEGGQGKLEDAEALEGKALAIRRKVLGDNHPDVAKALYLLGDRLRQRNELDAADQVLSTAFSMQTNLVGANDPSSLVTMLGLSRTLQMEGKLQEAENLERQELEVWYQRGEQDMPRAVDNEDELAQILVEEKKDQEAEQLLDTALTPAILQKPKSADLLILRAGLKARRGRWQYAADDGLLAFQAAPYGGHYAVIGALIAKTQNHAVYEQYCQKLLSMYGNTTSYLTADDVAKACLFLPDEKVDLNTVSQLADETVILGSNDVAAMPFLGLCKALSEYRRGNYGEAALWAQKSLDSPRPEAHGFARAVLAMADWKLHKENDAQDMLAAGEILAPASMPKSAIEDPGNLWLFWLYARIQMDEAENLIQGGATAGNRRK